jgi:TolB-like protein
MKFINITIVFSFLFLSVYARINMAVVDFEAKGISEVNVSILSERLGIELFKTDQFNIIERQQMDEILKEQGFQQTGCFSNECVVEIGKLVGVEQIVTGSVSKFENIYSISARVIDVQTGRVLNISTYDYKGELDNLLEYGVKKVALDIAQLNRLERGDVIENTDTGQDIKLEKKPYPSKGGFFILQVAFIYPFQFVQEHINIYGIKLNFPYGKNNIVYGLDCGVFNTSAMEMYGLQAGVKNTSEELLGTQFAIINENKTMAGVQIGLYNMTVDAVGIQIGLVNKAENLIGVQVGLINIIKNNTGPSHMIGINIGF